MRPTATAVSTNNNAATGNAMKRTNPPTRKAKTSQKCSAKRSPSVTRSPPLNEFLGRPKHVGFSRLDKEMKLPIHNILKLTLKERRERVITHV